MNNLVSEAISTIGQMRSSDSVLQNRWAVILAGGDGSRLLPFTRKIAGDDRPKQFCPVLGSTTLLDETRRRVALAFSPLKTMFVLTEKHQRYYDMALRNVPPQNLIVQPKNIGTAPAILYSLLKLNKISPSASVTFFPSDHYFSDNQAFMAHVKDAHNSIKTQPDSIVLLGIEPDVPDEEYGWIEPDSVVSNSETNRFFGVRRFWEKPTRALARKLMKRGCLWNSFVMVGTVNTFLNIIRDSTSDLYSIFSAIEPKLCTGEEKITIERLYDLVPESNFSKEVLTVAPQNLNVMPVRGSKWSDLGSPHRVVSTLEEIGMSASFAPTKQIAGTFAGGNIENGKHF